MVCIIHPTEHTDLYEFIVEVEITAADVKVLEQLKDIVDNTSLPIIVSDSINITEVNITISGKSSSLNFKIYGELEDKET